MTMDPTTMSGPREVWVACVCGFAGPLPYDFYPGEAGVGPEALTQCPACSAIIDVLELLHVGPL